MFLIPIPHFVVIPSEKIMQAYSYCISQAFSSLTSPEQACSIVLEQELKASLSLSYTLSMPEQACSIILEQACSKFKASLSLSIILM